MYFDMKLKQAKLDRRVLNLRFPKNCKKYLFKGKDVAFVSRMQMYLSAENKKKAKGKVFGG